MSLARKIQLSRALGTTASLNLVAKWRGQPSGIPKAPGPGDWEATLVISSSSDARGQSLHFGTFVDCRGSPRFSGPREPLGGTLRLALVSPSVPLVRSATAMAAGEARASPGGGKES